jgi:hypothetical protein
MLCAAPGAEIKIVRPDQLSLGVIGTVYTPHVVRFYQGQPCNSVRLANRCEMAQLADQSQRGAHMPDFGLCDLL